MEDLIQLYIEALRDHKVAAWMVAREAIGRELMGWRL